MKKVIAIVTIAALMLCLLPSAALAAPGDTGSDGDYAWRELTGSKVEVVSYLGSDTVITVPDTLNGMPVAGIADNVFSGKTSITSVTLPDGITYLGNGVFAGCTSLTGISLPDSVETIGDGCFYQCTVLESITLPASLTMLGESVFSGDASLETVVMRNNVTTMGSTIFNKCFSLSSITLSTRLTAISPSAFYLCSSLEHITIPDSVTSIGMAAFGGSHLRSIDIPGSVETIDSYAFNGLTTLTSVTLHDGLKTISDGAFVTSGIAAVTIPKTVTSIGQNAFAGCNGLSSVTILGAATDLDSGAFAGCPGLHKVTSLIETGYYSTAFSTSLLTDGIYGFAGTTTQTYAAANSVPFHALYKIVFESGSGTAVPWDYAEMDGTISEPADPTLSGHVFGRWYPTAACDTSPVTFPYTVKGTATLYAKWTEIKLISSVADGKIYTNGRITLTPNIEGGTWTFDSTYLSRDGGTFTAIKAGTSTITYTVDGVSTTYDVTIQDSTLPLTGQDFTWAWVLAGLSVCIGVLALIANISKRLRQM
jgi:hypothetical protein